MVPGVERQADVRSAFLPSSVRGDLQPEPALGIDTEEIAGPAVLLLVDDRAPGPGIGLQGDPGLDRERRRRAGASSRRARTTAVVWPSKRRAWPATPATNFWKPRTSSPPCARIERPRGDGRLCFSRRREIARRPARSQVSESTHSSLQVDRYPGLPAYQAYDYFLKVPKYHKRYHDSTHFAARQGPPGWPCNRLEIIDLFVLYCDYELLSNRCCLIRPASGPSGTPARSKGAP